MRRALLLALALVSLSACGRTTEVREPDLIVRGDQAVATPASPDRDARGLRIAAARIVIITHGEASDPFWAIVKKGGEDAGRQTGVAVSYRAPDTYDIARMELLIDQAVADHPDGLVISLPDATALGPAIKRAVAAGIPVVTINSGSDQFKKLGVLAHVGEPEYRAGFEGGKRMAAAGVRNAVCVNQEVGNAGLDVRCRAFAAGLATRGGHSRVVAVSQQDPRAAQRKIAAALASGDVDGIITLGPGGAGPALAALRAGGLGGRVQLATFDLSPEVLAAVRDGQMLFAIDQQPYLQGYLPVVLLAERARHDLFPAQGELIPTGPHFVTRANAAEAIQLSTEGIR
jgi:simple sugar transport system substrate-binding protein